MLVSGVVAGIAAGIAFGGEWRRLNSFTLQLWPLLVIGAGLRLLGELVPSSPLAVYFIGLDQGMTSVFGNSLGIHEFVHDGRHFLGFPCH